MDVEDVSIAVVDLVKRFVIAVHFVFVVLEMLLQLQVVGEFAP